MCDKWGIYVLGV